MARIPPWKLGPFEDWAIVHYPDKYNEWLGGPVDEIDFDAWAEQQCPAMVDWWLENQQPLDR